MVGAGLIITGISMVISNINKAREKILEANRRELRNIAHKIEAEGKRLCPVDTGTLRRSIRTIFPDKDSAFVGTGIEYSSFVEFGTSRMRAQPYLRPAARKYAGRFLKGIGVRKDYK